MGPLWSLWFSDRPTWSLQRSVSSSSGLPTPHGFPRKFLLVDFCSRKLWLRFCLFSHFGLGALSCDLRSLMDLRSDFPFSLSLSLVRREGSKLFTCLARHWTPFLFIKWCFGAIFWSSVESSENVPIPVTFLWYCLPFLTFSGYSYFFPKYLVVNNLVLSLVDFLQLHCVLESQQPIPPRLPAVSTCKQGGTVYPVVLNILLANAALWIELATAARSVQKTLGHERGLKARFTHLVFAQPVTLRLATWKISCILWPTHINCFQPCFYIRIACSISV